MTGDLDELLAGRALDEGCDGDTPVVDPPEGCKCAQGGSPGSLAWLAPLVLIAVRRRRA